MKNTFRIYVSLLLALTLIFGAFSAALTAFAAEPAETAVPKAGSGSAVKTVGAKLTDGGDPDATFTDATFTDATFTDATATDATATDALSAAAAVENGFTFIISNGQAVVIAVDETVKGEVVIPETLGGAPVGIIGVGAFRGNGAIVSVRLPDSVTAVDELAFADCAALERIDCGESLESLPESAYAGCAKLRNEHIHFPFANENFTGENHGDVMYDRDKTELIYVSSGCGGAFTVPQTVTYVRAGAFRDCTALTEVTFENPETAIGAYAFAGCTALETAALPEKLTEIREGTFSGCASLREVTIPGGLTAIGDGAFAGCAALPVFLIPERCKSLGNGIFENCTALRDVSITVALTALPDGMFDGCAALKKVQIPESVTAVGERTFCGCAALESVGSVLSYKRFGRDAFTGTAWYAARVDGPCAVGETLLFYKGEADKSVDLSKMNITAIAPGAFADKGTLEEVLLPAGLEEIGADAFAGCGKLASVSFDGTARIGEDAFAGTALAEAAANGELYVGSNLILAAPVATATDATATDATATDATATDAAPAAYTVRPGTKSIASGAFRALPGLEEIVLPDGVVILSDGAFAGLNGLKTVNIPDTVRYGDNAFDGIVPVCAHPDRVVRYADTAVCTLPYFSGCVYCADCAALLENGAILSAAGHRYQFVKQEVDQVMKEVVVIVACSVCGETKRIPISAYNVKYADSETVFADGAYLIVAQDVTAAQILQGCPEDSLVLTAEGAKAAPEQIAGSGMTVLFPSSRSYTVVLYGDADGDGKISPADARCALRISVSLEEHIDWRDKACHVVYDGKKAVLPEDARMILRASVNLEDAALFGKPSVPATPTDATPTDATPTDATPTDATPTDATPTDADPTGDPEKPDPPKPERIYLPGTYACKSEGGVYLRAYHGYDYSPMDIIAYQELVKVTDVFRDNSGTEPVWWGRITHNGVTGWAALSFFEQRS